MKQNLYPIYPLPNTFIEYIMVTKKDFLWSKGHKGLGLFPALTKKDEAHVIASKMNDMLLWSFLTDFSPTFLYEHHYVQGPIKDCDGSVAGVFTPVHLGPSCFAPRFDVPGLLVRPGFIR